MPSTGVKHRDNWCALAVDNIIPEKNGESGSIITQNTEQKLICKVLDSKQFTLSSFKVGVIPVVDGQALGCVYQYPTQ